MLTDAVDGPSTVSPPPSFVARTRALLRSPRTPAWLWGGGLVVAAVLIVSRSPYIVRKGRFWAEEGAVYFHRMEMLSSGIEGVWYVHARAGYLNLSANLATWLAAAVPLRHAPRVTVWFSFAVLLVVVWIALAWPSHLLTTTGSRLAAGLVLVVGMLAVPEIWLNSINLQTYLALATLLLAFVAIDDVSRSRAAAAIGVLVLAGLSGFYSAVLAPVFLFAAWRERSRRRWIQAGVLCLCLAIQVGSYLHASLSGTLADKREPATLTNLYNSVAGWHLNGLVAPNSFIRRSIRSPERGGSPLLIALIALGVLAVFVVALIALRRRYSVMLIMAFVLIEGTVLAGAFNGLAGGRYAVVPIGILTLTMLGAASSARRRWMRAVTAAGVAATTVVGLTQFWTAAPTTIGCVGCPSWATQVEQWERGEITLMEIWPYDRDEPFVMEVAPPDPPDAAPSDAADGADTSDGSEADRPGAPSG